MAAFLLYFETSHRSDSLKARSLSAGLERWLGHPWSSRSQLMLAQVWVD